MENRKMGYTIMNRVQLLGILLVIVSCVLSGCGQKKVEIAIKEESFELSVGEIAQLEIEVLTEGATINEAEINWKSNDESIVFVSADGKMQGINPGNTIVTATSTGNAVSCFVTVKEVTAYDALPSNEKYIVDAIVKSSSDFYNPASISVKEVRAASEVRIAAMNQLGGYAEAYYESLSGRLHEITEENFYNGIECPNISVQKINAALDEILG